MKTIFTNGCFDLLHEGHIFILKESFKLGNKLIVGLNSDESVKILKGDSRPIWSQDKRKKELLALDIVDSVVIFNEETPLNLIKKLRPNVIVKGGDYKAEDVVGYDIVDEVVIIPLIDGVSTTKIIEEGNYGNL